MLLGYLFTFIFIVTKAIMIPIAWTFNKVRLKKRVELVSTINIRMNYPKTSYAVCIKLCTKVTN